MRTNKTSVFIRVHSCPFAASLPAAEFTQQPGARRNPVTIYRGFRDPQCLRGLVDGKAGKETQFDDPALLRIEFREIVEGVVQCDQLQAALVRQVDCFLQSESLKSA